MTDLSTFSSGSTATRTERLVSMVGRSGESVSAADSRADRFDPASAIPDDQISREVYCVLGIPVDAVGMDDAVSIIADAMGHRQRLLFATPNLNFLAIAQSDAAFQESIIACDLSMVDGVAVIWIARLLGIPLRERVAGSDLFDALKAKPRRSRDLTVFLFGGAPQIAERACKALNAESGPLRCVGALNPGFVGLEEMSTDAITARINASGADFLMVSLGAAKGQEWLIRNRARLGIPVQAHLGATLNFQAGTLARAPMGVRRMGLEWLWRIKEEPQLWRRYWKDGALLARLLFTRVLPLMLYARLPGRRNGMEVERSDDDRCARVRLCGPATARHMSAIHPHLVAALQSGKAVVVDLSATTVVDARFLGACMMLNKQLGRNGARLRFIGVSRRVARLFRLNGAQRLLETAGPGTDVSSYPAIDAPSVIPEAGAR